MSIKFELDTEGVGQLLRSDEMIGVLSEYGNAVVNRAGAEDFKTKTSHGQKRANVTISPNSPKAYYSNLKHNTLLKALGGGSS